MSTPFIKTDPNRSESHQPIPIAIAGLGRTGWGNHANILAAMPDKFCIAAVSDPDPSRRDLAERMFHCATYETFEQLIATSGARHIVIATPSHLHCNQTVHALTAGWNVICEKPMATSLSETDAMIEAARASGGLLTIFQNSRYAPDFEKVRDVLSSGVLGRIIQIRRRWSRFGRRWDWQTLRKYGGGALNNTVPHPLDQILSLFPMEEPECFYHADQAVSLGDTEDHVKILLREEAMPLIDLEVSNADADPGPAWTVLGTCGHLQGDGTELRWKSFDPGSLPPREVDDKPSSDLTYNSESIPWIEESWVAPPTPVLPSRKFYERLHAAITENREPDVTPAQVRRVMSILERCRRLASVQSSR